MADYFCEFGGRDWRTVEYSDSRALDFHHYFNDPNTPTIFTYRFPKTEKLYDYKNQLVVLRPVTANGRYLTRQALDQIEAHSNIVFVEERDPDKSVAIEYRRLLAPISNGEEQTRTIGFFDIEDSRNIALYEANTLLSGCPVILRENSGQDRRMPLTPGCADNNTLTELTVLHETMHKIGATDVSIAKRTADLFPLVTFKRIHPSLDHQGETVMSYHDKPVLELSGTIQEMNEGRFAAKLGRLDKEWLKRHYPRKNDTNITLPNTFDEASRQVYHKARSKLGFHK